MRDDFWSGRPVLVTGATGLVGGWLVPALAQRGATVVALVRDQSPRCQLVRSGSIKDIAVVYGSLEDFGLLRRTMAEYSIQTVFHLAAQTLVNVAHKDPVGTLETNVRGTWNLLEAARQCDVAQMVTASSDKAYGVPENLPYLETHPLQGTYPYDVSKSCVDLISRMYATTYGVPVVVTRFANLFGGGDLNFSRSIPGVIQATLRGERFVIRSDGKFVRDFLYVEDAVEVYLFLAEQLAADPSLAGESFNFSLGMRLTVLELAHRVLDMLGRGDLEPTIQNTARMEIREQYLSTEKARQRLNWSPRYSLDEGLKRTIDWYREFLHQDSSSH
jgi:CDP-glucose 4,6-dehydratase